MAIDPMNVWASMKIGAAHKKKFEAWLANKFIVAGLSDPAELARHIVLLMDGLFSTVLIRRDADYAASAARGARHGRRRSPFCRARRHRPSTSVSAALGAPVSAAIPNACVDRIARHGRLILVCFGDEVGRVSDDALDIVE